MVLEMIVKLQMRFATLVCICLFCAQFSANAETSFPDQMTMEDAVDTALAQVEQSTYKDVEVLTTAGSVSGEYLKRSGEVLILKRKTGNIHLQLKKEKINYILIDVKNIISIAFYKLD